MRLCQSHEVGATGELRRFEWVCGLIFGSYAGGSAIGGNPGSRVLAERHQIRFFGIACVLPESIGSPQADDNALP